MGLLDRLLGREPQQFERGPYGAPKRRAVVSDDEQAVERYRYLLRTAPPETIERAHAEAFWQLTPEQRRMVLAELSSGLPEGERAAAMRGGDDPRALARTATRAEMRNPGTLERQFGGMSMGGLMAGSFLSTIAGVVVGSAIVDAFFVDEGGGDSGGDSGDSTDAGGYDDSGDAGGDFSDLGSGDFGDVGGDFGGGDF
jgi:hypothetical protein